MGEEMMLARQLDQSADIVGSHDILRGDNHLAMSLIRLA